MASALTEQSKFVVAAIDIGTSCSGYAFSFVHEYERDPLNVSINQTWYSGSKQLVSSKTPTVLLLTPDKQFHSFGFEAENQFSELAEENKHADWYYFRQFKMTLHTATVSWALA
jgi:hypothetical protein